MNNGQLVFVVVTDEHFSCFLPLEAIASGAVFGFWSQLNLLGASTAKVISTRKQQKKIPRCRQFKVMSETITPVLTWKIIGVRGLIVIVRTSVYILTPLQRHQTERERNAAYLRFSRLWRDIFWISLIVLPVRDHAVLLRFQIRFDRSIFHVIRSTYHTSCAITKFN